MCVHNCLPNDRWVRWLLTPALVFVAQATSTTYLADFWHHLARGRVIVEEGRLLDHDIFTYTAAGQSFQDVNWLTQVCYYVFYRQGGLALVQVVNAFALAITLGLIVGHCRRVSGSLSVGAGVSVAVFLGLWQVLTIRPQTFSLLLFALLYDLLDRSKDSPRLPWLALPIMALWANLHGAFPAGLLLIGCFLAGEVCRRVMALRSRERQGACAAACSLTVAALKSRSSSLALVLAGGCVATFLNPYGWHIYQYVVLTASTAGTRHIDEWLPPALDEPIGVAWLVSMVVLAALLFMVWKRRGVWPRIEELCLIGLFLPLACGSARMVAWWLVIAAPMVARRLTLLWPSQAKDEQPCVGAAMSFAALLLVAMLSLPSLQRFNPLLTWRSQDRTEHDLDEVRAYLDRQGVLERIFCRFEWGEYVSWAFHPRYKAFMDGRIEIYSDPVWAAYGDVTTGNNGWSSVLDEYGVEALVLDEDYHGRTGLLAQVNRTASWQRTFQAGAAVVYERTQAHTSDLSPSGPFAKR